MSNPGACSADSPSASDPIYATARDAAAVLGADGVQVACGDNDIYQNIGGRKIVASGTGTDVVPGSSPQHAEGSGFEVHALVEQLAVITTPGEVSRVPAPAPTCASPHPCANSVPVVAGAEAAAPVRNPALRPSRPLMVGKAGPTPASAPARRPPRSDVYAEARYASNDGVRYGNIGGQEVRPKDPVVATSRGNHLDMTQGPPNPDSDEAEGQYGVLIDAMNSDAAVCTSSADCGATTAAQKYDFSRDEQGHSTRNHTEATTSAPAASVVADSTPLDTDDLYDEIERHLTTSDDDDDDGVYDSIDRTPPPIPAPWAPPAVSSTSRADSPQTVLSPALLAQLSEADRLQVMGDIKRGIPLDDALNAVSSRARPSKRRSTSDFFSKKWGKGGRKGSTDDPDK